MTFLRRLFSSGIGLGAAALACLLAGCGPRQTLVELGDQKQEFRLGNGTEPSDLDPQVTVGVPEMMIELSLFEGLVSPDPKTVAPRPGIAQSWDISPDGKVYTFHLRPNARWSNGDPVTARDFVESYKRILMPSLGAQMSYLLYPVLNAEAYNLGKITNFDQVGFKALNDHTLRVTLHSPTPYLLSMMVNPVWDPVPVGVIKKYGAIDDLANTWTRPGRLVCNGPFMLREWRMNSHVLVVKNPQYWDALHVRLNKIYFDAMSSADTEERMFRSGMLHVTSQVPPSKIAFYRKYKPNLLSISPMLGVYYYELNVTRPPLNDSRVRRALAMAIDRRAITETIARGGEMPAFALTPPGTGGFTAKSSLREDPAAARRLLAEAGYPDGKGFPTIEILFNTLQAHKAIAEAIQAMWKNNLNIDVRLHNEEWKVYLDTLHHTNYNVGRFAWVADYNDPSDFLDLFTTGNGNNDTGWSNAQYDKACQDASQTDDEARRFADFQKASDILVNDMPVIPIYYYTMPRLIRPSVKGWYPNLLDMHNYKYIWLDPKGD